LAWKCSRDLLNLSLQHLVEAQLILYSYCEAIHLTIHTLQKIISGLKSLAKVVIDLYLISDNISEGGLIPIEILPITTLRAVVEGKVGLILSRIEASVRTKSIEISNEIHILVDIGQLIPIWLVSALLRPHAGIDHFGVTET
jgi:hypothetical protein